MTVVLWQDCTGSERQKATCQYAEAGWSIYFTCFHYWNKVHLKTKANITPVHDMCYLIGSKLHPGFSFNQSCIYLHNDRFYGIGTAPALTNANGNESVPVVSHNYYFIYPICIPVLWEVPCTMLLPLKHNWKKKKKRFTNVSLSESINLFKKKKVFFLLSRIFFFNLLKLSEALKVSIAQWCMAMACAL